MTPKEYCEVCNKYIDPIGIIFKCFCLRNKCTRLKVVMKIIGLSQVVNGFQLKLSRSICCISHNEITAVFADRCVLSSDTRSFWLLETSCFTNNSTQDTTCALMSSHHCFLMRQTLPNRPVVTPQCNTK